MYFGEKLSTCVFVHRQADSASIFHSGQHDRVVLMVSFSFLMLRAMVMIMLWGADGAGCVVAARLLPLTTHFMFINLPGCPSPFIVPSSFDLKRSGRQKHDTILYCDIVGQPSVNRKQF